MFSFTPSLDPLVAARNLSLLLAPALKPDRFAGDIRRLRNLFAAFTAACPPPWPAPGLAVTPEVHYRSDLWLPLELIAPSFVRLYRAALGYPPNLASTPFAGAAGWAAVVCQLPPFCGCSANPATLLERLLEDDELRLAFLCWSFMPKRFYGSGSDRYPGQRRYLRQWLAGRREGGGGMRCLDAACGDGAATYGLARLFIEQGWQPAGFALEGWTLDPLEVWAAAHGRFPHDPPRELDFRKNALPFIGGEGRGSLLFRAIDLERSPSSGGGFDLIVCNGLLGGPIIHEPRRVAALVRTLAELLRPGGLLVAADHFHGGWKRLLPPETLGELFGACGLGVSEAGEGIAGSKRASSR